ncbi:MAG: oxygenase MpaB family protein [Polyangiales bacterium]
MARVSGVHALGQARLGDAIERAASWLWSKQRADGSWNVVADMGPACTAQVTVALAYAGVLQPDEAADVARFLRAAQQPDGSFLPYPYARGGTAAATASAWAALCMCGLDARDEAVVKAQHFIYAHGGLEPIEKALVGGELAPLYLALAGLVPAKRLPRLPLGWALVDPLVEALSYVVHGGVPFGALQLGIVARALRGEAPEKRACAKLESWIDTWQNADGSINANALQTAVTLVALRAMGEKQGDRRFDRAVQSLRSLGRRDERGLWFATFESDVWTTALDLRALLSSGAHPRDPRIVRAIEYLLRCQSETPQPRMNNRRPDAVRTGGWAFQRENVTMVDNDDTGMVLSVLGHWLEHDRHPESDLLHESVSRAIARGRAFLLSMQNEDGGFSAFVRDLPKRRPGPIMDRGVERPSSLTGWAAFVRNPPPSLGDPSTEDVTARALLGLAKTGSARNEPAAQEAIAFLRRFQQANGSWWGRWVVNYLPATAYVLSACASLGIGRETPWIEKAVEWLVSLQNEDGGFGEWVDSYVEPSRAGLAASTPPLTGLVLCALLDMGLADHPATARATEYLLTTQLPEGGWPNTDYLAVFVPPDAFYEYPGTNDHAPLDALARVRALRATRAPVIEAVSTFDAQLDRLSTVGDPFADEAAAALDRDKQWGALFAALATGRALPELAAPVRALVEATSKLPSSIDPARLLAGQKMFARHSWAMGNAFFFASIPASYAFPKGAEVLTQSGPLATDVRKRLLDTGHFMWAVMTPGAFEEGGAAYREILRVRLVHSRVRRALIARGWEGEPIDQASLLGTTLVLSWVAIQAMEKLGPIVPEDDAEALLHAWRAVGALVGVSEDLLPRSMAEATAQAETLRRRVWARSESGSALARELVRSVQAYVPLRALEDWPIDMIRHTAGDELADMLDLPAAGRTRPLIARTADFLRHEGRRLTPIDGLVHGITVSVIEAQRLPMVFGTALQRAFAKRDEERRAVAPAETDSWNLPETVPAGAAAG